MDFFKTKTLKSKVINDKAKNIKISNNRTDSKNVVNKKAFLAKEEPTDNRSNNIINTEEAKSLCDQVKNCDIDKIAELLIKKGKNKPFPDIASN